VENVLRGNVLDMLEKGLENCPHWNRTELLVCFSEAVEAAESVVGPEASWPHQWQTAVLWTELPSYAFDALLFLTHPLVAVVVLQSSLCDLGLASTWVGLTRCQS
jgi:hypothetical protein